MSLVDTNVLVRYLTGEPPSAASRAAEIIDSQEITITDVVISETAYVLKSLYKTEREVIVDNIIGLLLKNNVRVFALDKSTVVEALLLSRPSNRVSLPDALIWAAARSERDMTVYSFDSKFPKEGITVRG